MANLIIRCSELSKFMTNGRKKGEIGDTCMSLLKEKALNEVLGFTPHLENKYLEKGIAMEDKSMELLSAVNFEKYTKHVGRETNDYITGECDILTDTSVRDIKSSWNIQTFPWFVDDAIKSVSKSGYDWQLQGYLWLYDRQKGYVDYCLVTTPEGLRKYEPDYLHEVDHIDASKRVTTVEIDRDPTASEQIIEKWEICNPIFQELVDELINK
jgi:hypothetical protein